MDHMGDDLIKGREWHSMEKEEAQCFSALRLCVSAASPQMINIASP